jgi:hypothetical protein
VTSEWLWLSAFFAALIVFPSSLRTWKKFSCRTPVKAVCVARKERFGKSGVHFFCHYNYFYEGKLHTVTIICSRRTDRKVGDVRTLYVNAPRCTQYFIPHDPNDFTWVFVTIGISALVFPVIIAWIYMLINP